MRHTFYTCDLCNEGTKDGNKLWTITMSLNSGPSLPHMPHGPGAYQTRMVHACRECIETKIPSVFTYFRPINEEPPAHAPSLGEQLETLISSIVQDHLPQS